MITQGASLLYCLQADTVAMSTNLRMHCLRIAFTIVLGRKAHMRIEM